VIVYALLGGGGGCGEVVDGVCGCEVDFDDGDEALWRREGKGRCC